MATGVLIDIDDNAIEQALREENSSVIDTGVEPGASVTHYLVTTDSYEELDNSDAELQNSGRTRSKSGTIRDIKREKKTTALRAVRDSGLLSSDDAGNNSSNSATVSDTESDANNMYEPAIEEVAEKIRHLSADDSAVDDDPELTYVHSHEWRNQNKHIFVLSQSGKPIYCRHGNEEKLVSLFGVMQALVSFIRHSSEPDELRSVVTNNRKIIFSMKDNLILVAVSSLEESFRHLQLELLYVHSQILSQVTLSQINKIFHRQANYDLRRMIGGTEKFIDNMLDYMESDMSYLMGSVRCLPLNNSTRENITQTLVQACKPVKDSLVYALILARDRLVTAAHMKKFSLHPQDLHILINIMQTSDAFKTVETWLPICLPKFDSSGFLNMYVSYLDEMCNSCVLLLTVDNELFSTLSQCKATITERLNKIGALQAIAESVAVGDYSCRQAGIPEMNHFIYKSRSTAQCTSPSIGLPYLTRPQKERLHGLYLSCHGQIHSSARPLRLVYKITQYESLLGWVTDGFELYAVFGPLISKSAAIASINKLLKWIKKEENRLFIMNSATF